MNNKKTAVFTVIGYFGVMMIVFFTSNLILTSLGVRVVGGMDVDSTNIIIKFIQQIPPTVFLFYCIKKYYRWSEIGFGKTNKKELIWSLPYAVVITIMIIKFIVEVNTKVTSIDRNTYVVLIFTLLGTVMASFSEEVIFRGIYLNSFKSNKYIIIPMIISSIGFSISHVTTIVTGISIFDVIGRVVFSSLMGFAFVGLAIKINNIWTITIFHIMWNFIILASNSLGVELSIVANLCSILDLLMAIILWTIIILDIRKRRRISLKEKNLVANIKYLF